ncbi:hypothetical protein L2E82_51381 [Cichorium intybus]|nr:hypothetical protein L2E82_51381 [Cichorium intybus]
MLEVMHKDDLEMGFGDLGVRVLERTEKLRLMRRWAALQKYLEEERIFLRIRRLHLNNPCDSSVEATIFGGSIAVDWMGDAGEDEDDEIEKKEDEGEV